MMAGGGSKVCGGRRKEEERLNPGPRKSSNARGGLKSGHVWSTEHFLVPNV